MRFATTVGSFEQEAGRVQSKFSDGTGGLFDVLVGADEVGSQIRRLAFAQEKSLSRFLGAIQRRLFLTVSRNRSFLCLLVKAHHSLLQGSNPAPLS
jgi:2-polyprenyl-6-methoxyphenol hydroxylase-like FAD-dependent oxidoreductase